MSDEKNTINIGPGVGFFGILFFILLIAKLAGVGISWFVVFLPLIVGCGFVIVVFIIVLLITFCIYKWLNN